MLDSLDVVNKDDVIEWIYSLQVLPTEDSEWVFSFFLIDINIFTFALQLVHSGWLLAFIKYKVDLPEVLFLFQILLLSKF